MKEHELAPAPGSRHARKRVGRGDGSGHGTYSGRGQKGQKARTGKKIRPGFEGGQLPLVKRLPEKRGFTNIFRTVYEVINVRQLGCFPPQSQVGPELMASRGLIPSARRPVKVLGDGEIHVPLVVKAHSFSTAARRKIEAAGGKVEGVGVEVQ